MNSLPPDSSSWAIAATWYVTYESGYDKNIRTTSACSSVRTKKSFGTSALPLGAMPLPLPRSTEDKDSTPGAWRKRGVRPVHDTVTGMAVTTIPGFDSAQSNTLEPLQIHISDPRLYPTNQPLRALPSDFCLVPSSMGVSRICYPSILACERSTTVLPICYNHSRVFPTLPSDYNCTYVPKTVHFSGFSFLFL